MVLKGKTKKCLARVPGRKPGTEKFCGKPTRKGSDLCYDHSRKAERVQLEQAAA